MSFESLKEFISNGGNIESRNSLGSTKLHVAIFDPDIKSTKFLIEQKANLNALACGSRYSVFWFAQDLAMAKLLAQSKANVNIRNINGDTPLHLEVERARLWAIEFLMENGADAGIRNKSGKTPLDLVANLKNETVEVLKLLLPAPDAPLVPAI